eukprot:6476735-Amphidinium_carterae.1
MQTNAKAVIWQTKIFECSIDSILLRLRLWESNQQVAAGVRFFLQRLCGAICFTKDNLFVQLSYAARARRLRSLSQDCC